MNRPLCIPLFAAVAGLCAAVLLGISIPSWSLTALLLCLFLSSFTRGAASFVAALAAFSFLWGGSSLNGRLHQGEPWRALAGETAWVIEGVVDARPEWGATGGRFLLDEVRLFRGETVHPCPGRLLVRVKEGRGEIVTGDTVRFFSRVRIPRPFGLPGEEDYALRLALKGVGGTAFVEDVHDVVLVSSGWGWRSALDRLAAGLASFIARALPGEEGGVMKALLLGDMGDVPEALNDAYARSGVNHILSISGFHVGILYLSLFQALYFLARLSEGLTLRMNLKRVLLPAALPVTVGYLLLSGCAPATVRSVVMIGCLTVALYLRRETDPVHLIVLAACAILALSPETLFEVSFQLSFLAIWGLAVLTPLFARPFRGLSGVGRALLLSVLASLAAILATAVPVAYYFHRFSAVGLFCNLIVVPLMGYGAVVLGFAALFFIMPLPHLAQGLLWVAGRLVLLSDRVILFCAKAPVLTWQPDRLDILLSLIVLFCLTFVRASRWRAGLTIPLIIILLLRTLPTEGEEGRLGAVFLSVGQGEATLLTLPDGKRMLIDGGGSYHQEGRVGERLLIPALLALGVRRIDYLVLSHPHPDHFEGLIPLAVLMEVGEFWESGVPCEAHEYRQLKWILADRGVPVRRVGAWLPPFAAGGAQVTPLWPPSTAPPPSGDLNDASLVFHVGYGASSILFTGDLGGEAEEEVLSRGGPPRCTILKVGHHGSRYSSSELFLKRCAARSAVISAGYGNSFHLPAPSTVARLTKCGIRVYRTDLEGSVKADLAGDGGYLLTTPWRGHFN